MGNLLPLAQSVNASLQNKSFDEKKNPRQEERRGYADGSHSEIQVARYEEWTGRAIYERSQELLSFLSTRWNCNLSEEQIKELAFVSFVKLIKPAKLPAHTGGKLFAARAFAAKLFN